MSLILFGRKFSIENDFDLPLIWNTKQVGTITKNDGIVLVSFTEGVAYQSNDHLGFSVSIPTDTQIQLNIKVKEVTYKGAIIVSILGIPVVNLEASLSSFNELIFSFSRNSILEQLLYDFAIGEHYNKFQNIILVIPPRKVPLIGCAFDLVTSSVDLFPLGDSHFKIIDSIVLKPGPDGGSSGESLFFNQRLGFDRIRLQEDSNLQIFLNPEFKYLHFFPDVISMDREMSENKAELQIKYQLAFANGMFCFEKLQGNEATASWVKSLFSDSVPLMIMPNISDANSYPVALESNNNVFPIDYRAGLIRLLNTTQPDYFQKTIRGLSVGEILKATLHELAFETIDWDRKEKQLFGVNLTKENASEALQFPFWLTPAGKVTVKETSPDVLYSLVKGAWLEMKNRQTSSALKCSFKSEPVKLKQETIYHIVSLELDSTEWDFYSQYEERESHKAFAPSTPVPTPVYSIDSRKFSSQSSAPFQLPATDYLLGAANILDPEGKIVTSISKEVQDKIQRINSRFSDFNFSPANQEHIQGFLRKYTENKPPITPDTVFQYPPPKATNIQETLPGAVLLKSSTVSFKHGDYRNAIAAKSSITENSVLLDNASVQTIFNRLHHLWNDYLFLMENAADSKLKRAATAVQKIRIYLENLTDEQEVDKLRVRFRNEVFYRLRFEKLAPTPSNQEALLHQVKTLIKGNFNAIPGLGKRLRNIQLQAEELTVAKLQTAWNRGWDELTTETDKILYALFDTVYKQFDRGILNKFLEIADVTNSAIGEIRQEVFFIFDYLELKPQDIKAFERYVEQEITELLSEVSQGVDPYVEEVRNIWEAATAGCPDVSTEEMKAAYGVRFGIDTFKNILKDLKSNKPHIKEQAKRVVQCLERQHKQKVRNELLNQWNILSAKPWSQIEKWLSSTFEAYQEDIWAFYSFIVEVQNTKAKVEEYIELIRKISQVKNPNDLIKLKNDPGFKEIYNEASRIIQKEYGDDLKRLENLAQQEFEKLVDIHWNKVVFVAHTLKQVVDEYNYWKDIITKLKTAIEDLKFTITAFITDLKDETKQKAMLRVLVLYLLEKYQVNISLPDLRIDPPQYIVYSKHLSFNTSAGFKKQMDNLLEKLHLQKLVLCKLGNDKQWDQSFSESSVYILKLGNDMDMASILKEINNSNKKPGLENGPFNDQRSAGNSDSPLEQIIKDLHPEMNDPKWRGIFIYKPFADIRKDTLLRDLVGKSSLQMSYAAIGGTTYKKDDTLDIPFNIYARVKENADKLNIELGQDEEKPDAHLTLVKFDALIKNTRLEYGDALLQLDFRNVFSKQYPGEEKEKIMIRGALPTHAAGDDTPRDFEFAVTFHPEKELKELPGFMDSLQLRGIKATKQAGRSLLEIDGTLKFKEFDAIVNVKKLALKNFYIILPPSGNGTENPAGKPRGVNFDIGSIEFNIDKPRPINYWGLELLPRGLGYIKKYEGELAESFDKNVIWINGQPSLQNSFTYLKLDVQFGKLPSLGGVNAKDLKMEGVVGIKVKDSKPDPAVYFGITGLSSKEISIDLFRFISIYIQELLIQKGSIGEGDSKTPVTFMGAKKIDLKILDWSPLGKKSNFSIAFFHNNPPVGSAERNTSPRSAMIAAYSKKSGVKVGILKIYWILLANNLQFKADILNHLLSPSAIDNDEPMKEMMDRVFEGIQKSREGESFADISFTRDPSWLFGASFSIAGILDRCTFILHDQYYYGIMLASKQPWFKELFGTDALSLAYIPGASKQLDRFRIEMRLPALDLMGPMQSGLIALEYGLNRDFLIDFGFPWKSGNTYLWDRTFSLASGIYETRMGFYFEKRTDVIIGGDKTIKLGAGVAISYGYKVGARTAVAWAEAGISVTVILMGSVTFLFEKGGNEITLLKGSIQKIEVIGVIGIYAYARGGINVWVLSAEIRAEIVAALAGHLIYMPQGNSSLTFTATLSVRYSASCRVKVGFVKITFRVSGQLSYGVSGRIALN